MYVNLAIHPLCIQKHVYSVATYASGIVLGLTGFMAEKENKFHPIVSLFSEVASEVICQE